MRPRSGCPGRGAPAHAEYASCAMSANYGRAAAPAWPCIRLWPQICGQRTMLQRNTYGLDGVGAAWPPRRRDQDPVGEKFRIEISNSHDGGRGRCHIMAASAARAWRRMPREHGVDRRRFPCAAEGGVRVLSVCRVGHRSAIDQEARSFLAAQECGGFALLRTTMRSNSQCAQTHNRLNFRIADGNDLDRLTLFAHTGASANRATTPKRCAKR